MIDKAGKSSANQNGGQTSVRYLELETEHPPMAPNSTVKTSYFWSGGLSYCALGAAAIRIRFSSVIFDLEERWAESAQLFTFYWALTRNKFQFSTKLRCDKVSVIYFNIVLTPYWNLEEIDSAITWSTGQAWRSRMMSMDGSQASRNGSISHITYVRVGDNRAYFWN